MNVSSAAGGQSKARTGRHAPRLFVVVNGQASGTADPQAELEATLQRLRAAGASAEGVATHSLEELEGALAKAESRRVVLVGGDGSLHAVANLPGALPELALLPSGRANNVARALGIPEDPDAAAHVAGHAPARPLDAIEVHAAGSRTVCVEGLSAGFQADARADYDGSNSAEVMAGVRALAGAVARYRPYRVALATDGETFYDGSAGQVFISNLPLFGFGFCVDPFAQADDGAFEAIVVPARTRWALLRALALAYRGHHVDDRQTVVRRARTARLSQPLPLACDGQPLPVSTADIRIIPRHLALAAPPL